MSQVLLLFFQKKQRYVGFYFNFDKTISHENAPLPHLRSSSLACIIMYGRRPAYHPRPIWRHRNTGRHECNPTCRRRRRQTLSTAHGLELYFVCFLENRPTQLFECRYQPPSSDFYRNPDHKVGIGLAVQRRIYYL